MFVVLVVMVVGYVGGAVGVEVLFWHHYHVVAVAGALVRGPRKAGDRRHGMLLDPDKVSHWRCSWHTPISNSRRVAWVVSRILVCGVWGRH